MRVLLIANSWPSPQAPYQVIVPRIVQGLRQAGVTVDVMTVERKVHRRAYTRAAFDVLRMNFSSQPYDVVHGHTGHCGVLACLQFRVPVVMTYVGYDLDVPAEDWEGVRTKIERFFFRSLSLFVAGTIAQSRRGAARIPRLGRSRSEVIPNGVDFHLFAPMPRAEARRRLGWSTHAPVALFAADPSRFTKRFELAEAAVAEARRQVPELELLVAHPVPPDEMPLWMNAADVLLLSSVGEGSPNVVKEALACNLPVVSADVGDVADLLAGVNRCHVCPPEARALGAALVDVVRQLPERSDGRDRSPQLSLPAISARMRNAYVRASVRGPGMLGFLARPRRSRAHSPHRPGS